MPRSLYETIGGFNVISKIVLSFYDKVLDSDKVASYFTGIDMKRLIDHQTKFICSLLGGPASFSDEQLRHAHREVKVTDEAFDEITALFSDALHEASLKPVEITQIVSAFESKRPLIVSQ
ncbi:group 1 truncated hemoglobin [Pseudorhodoplanes sp.]|jgi:hemoglobin|uniref:truncated hemoglobin n=1 Tax=Pseudorhodoplanes sp. TaxID=1934341 RepID=UPI002CEBF41B|nr:group 1 truncated hemoglobin [Pseudorhodoplanes sp.]HWV41758.1 group 1 truncated hemoglobin [Pseudorhodoplanes sp.]